MKSLMESIHYSDRASVRMADSQSRISARVKPDLFHGATRGRAPGLQRTDEASGAEDVLESRFESPEIGIGPGPGCAPSRRCCAHESAEA